MTKSTPVFRIDKFVVPSRVLREFVDKMSNLKITLQAMPGCIRAEVLTQIDGPGQFNVLTMVEWQNMDAVFAAKSAMQSYFLTEGFDPKAYIDRLGVDADLGLYLPIGA